MWTIVMDCVDLAADVIAELSGKLSAEGVKLERVAGRNHSRPRPRPIPQRTGRS